MMPATEYCLNFLARGDFADVLERVKGALKDRGFGTLSEIDVQAILKEKVGEDPGPYTILGVCNPVLAAQALATEPKIGVFLPCTVVIRGSDGRVQIHAQDPELMAAMVGQPGLAELAAAVRDRITDGIAAALA